MKKTPDVNVIFLAATLSILIITIAIALGVSLRQHDLIMDQTHASADALFESIVLTRRWNAAHGGIYVLKRDGMESNPYLDNPDITTADGEVYTKKNPALMTREISELAQGTKAFSFHITSLAPFNANNMPDAWEANALHSFANGEKCVSEVFTINNSKMFRLMRPLYFEESCNECHGNQGYKVGDIRGGISVLIPFEATDRQLSKNMYWMIFLTVSTVVLFGIIIYIFLWRLLNKLAVLNALKDKLLGVVAHDCRNLLTLIKGNIEIILDGIVGDVNVKQREILIRIDSSTMRLSALVDDLLDTSVVEQGQLALKKTLCDPGSVFQAYCEFSRPYASAKHMTISLDLEPDLPKVSFDQNRVGQVMGNLIGNAIKYANPHTEIQVRVERRADGILVSVADHGPGFDPQDIPKLFEGLTTVSGLPTSEKSTGLGLVIAKHIVEKHGGRLWAESTPGKGATFFFTLPA